MKIGIDIDNVISNFNDELLKEYLKHDKELRNTGIINKDVFIRYGMFDWTEKEETEFYKNSIERIAIKLKPIHRATETIKKLKEDQLNKIEPLKLSFNVLIQRLNNERRKLKDLEELIKLQESSKDIAQKRGKDILVEEYEKQIENTLEKCNKQEALIVQLQPVINNCKKLLRLWKKIFKLSYLI